MLEKKLESCTRKNVTLVIKEVERNGKIYKDLYLEFDNNFTVAIKPAFQMSPKEYRILMDLLEGDSCE